jgi:hypothetical protein
MDKLKHLHLQKRWLGLSLEARVWGSVLVLFLVVGGIFGFAQLQDYRNEQFLRGIVADFDQLEADLENELGVDVEDKSGCFTTSEKFGEGKTGCFAKLSVFGAEDMRGLFKETIVRINSFSEIDEITDRFYELKYSSWPCNVGFNETNDYSSFGLDCPIPVRAGNTELVREIF